MRKASILLMAMVLCLSVSLIAGTTGKITGRVTDAETGQPMPGVNVTIEGSSMGAVTNLDGYYMILNVPPGTCRLKFSIIGYAKSTVQNVQVQIDLTTTIDAKLQSTAVVTGEVVVTAQRPLVQRDISASQINIETKTIETMPIPTVMQALTLQAGIQQGSDGLVVRGGGTNQTIFMVDGFSLNDERSNIPYAAVGLSATQEIQVQTGGFSAEYGNVRSGVVNVVTKEGDISRYSGTVNVRMRLPGKKYLGISPYDPNSYFNRPYTDPAVMWTGTKNGAWDAYTQRENIYFQGWNAISYATVSDKDPTNDLTPEGAYRLWQWQRRRQGDIQKPDYVVDAGFGGPVPFLAQELGNLRFYVSHYEEQDMFVVPLSRDAYTDVHTNLKLTSDITPSMKLILKGLYGEIGSVSQYEWTTAPPGYVMRSDEEVADLLSSSGDGIATLYMQDRYSPAAVYRYMIGAKLTHVLNPTMFYEVSAQRNQSRYNTYQAQLRDTMKRYEIVPGYFVDQAPDGYWGYSTGAIDGVMSMGGWMNLGRDQSVIASNALQADITTQMNEYNQVKAGFRFVYDDLDINTGTYSPSMSTWTRSQIYHVFPYRLGVYAQDKLEFQGFIANLGLRLDYSNPNSEFYDLGAYDPSYGAGLGKQIDQTAPKEKAKAELYLSPRLGISHPITENSKLYFNYGHFLSEPSSSYRFRLQRESNGLVTSIGNPNLKLEKTIAYELGFAQNLFDMFLLNLAAYYKDVTNQPGWVNYQNINASINYSEPGNNNYADIRGFEVTLTKTVGPWFRGFINYTYDVRSSGYFGFLYYYQDPNKQRAYLLQNPYQSKPHPRPYARANIEVRTPDQFGPTFAGTNPLGTWSVNVLADWMSGMYDTYNPNSIPGVVDNVRWADWYNVDLRLSKTVHFSAYEVQLYMDVTNVFNFKHLVDTRTGYAPGFSNTYDYQDYLASLCFPWMEGDKKGNDQIGDYRPNGVAYDPLEPNPTNDPAITAKNNARKDKKSYIDMPDITSTTFLNIREISFGIRINF